MEWNKVVPELTVFDLATSHDFYTQVLGFRVLFAREGFVYLEQDGAQLMLEQYHATGWNIEPLERPLGRGINLQIELATVAGVHQRLQARNYPLYRDLRDAWYRTGDTESGQRELLVQDLDGYLLRFCELLGERTAEP